MEILKNTDLLSPNLILCRDLVKQAIEQNSRNDNYDTYRLPLLTNTELIIVASNLQFSDGSQPIIITDSEIQSRELMSSHLLAIHAIESRLEGTTDQKHVCVCVPNYILEFAFDTENLTSTGKHKTRYSTNIGVFFRCIMERSQQKKLPGISFLINSPLNAVANIGKHFLFTSNKFTDDYSA